MKLSDLPVLQFITCMGATITLVEPPPLDHHPQFFWGVFEKDGEKLWDGMPMILDGGLPAARFFASQISLEDYHTK